MSMLTVSDGGDLAVWWRVMLWRSELVFSCSCHHHVRVQLSILPAALLENDFIAT
jgi:hypothetical protein